MPSYPTTDEDIQSQLQNSLDVEQMRVNGASSDNALRVAFDQLQLQTTDLTHNFEITTTYGGITYRADKELAGVIYTVDHQLDREVQVAKIDSDARIAVAKINKEASVYDADRQLAGVTLESNQRAATQIYTVQTETGVQAAGNQLDYQARVFTAQSSKDASVYGSDQDLTGRRYSADQGLIGDRYQADQQFAGINLREIAENNRQTQKLIYADGKFNLVYPLVQKSIADAEAGVSSTPNLSFTPPFVSSSGYYSPGDIQAQVNAQLARNDARTTSQVRQMQGDLAGRGFSSNSPLAAMLTVGLFGKNLQANAEAERETRFQATKLNGDAVFAAQQLLQQQFNQQQQAALDSERNQVTRQVGLVGSLAQLIGGLT